MKLDLDKKNMFMKSKDMNVGQSPMPYNVVRNSVIFDPLITSQENVRILQSKFKKLLTHLMKLNLFPTSFCDKVMQECLEFVGYEMKLHSDVF